MTDAFRLDGKVAVVTGGGKGIGRGIALCLAQAGADVVVASRTNSDVQSVADEVRALGRRSIGISVDVTDSLQMETLVDSAKELGVIDIWVNNAGGLPDATPRYLTRTPEDRWDAQMDLNLKAVFTGCVAAAGSMESGAIVNLSLIHI